MTTMTQGPRPSDRFIPWYFVGFFILLILVLVPMCVIAVRTNSGLVTESAYDKGLAYNQSLERAGQQADLKWKGQLTVTPGSAGQITARFFLTNAAHQPLSGAAVKLWFVRPTQSGKDQTVVMKDETKGTYSAATELPLPGLWEARVSATLHDQNFQTSQRIVLP